MTTKRAICLHAHWTWLTIINDECRAMVGATHHSPIATQLSVPLASTCALVREKL